MITEPSRRAAALADALAVSFRVFDVDGAADAGRIARTPTNTMTRRPGIIQFALFLTLNPSLVTVMFKY